MTEFVDAETGIRQLLARYADAVWRKDFAAFGDCFTEDAEWRLGGRVIKGRTACAKFLEDVMPYFDRVLMTMATPLVQLTGKGTAIGRTYVTELNARKDRKPAYSISTYYDRFVLQGDRWRLAWHHFQLHYIGPMDMSGRFFAAKDYGPPFGMPGPDEPATPPESEMF